MMIVSVKLYLFLFDANISARASASVLVNTTGASIRWQKNIGFGTKWLALIHRAVIGTSTAWSRWLQGLTIAEKSIRLNFRALLRHASDERWGRTGASIASAIGKSQNISHIEFFPVKFTFWRLIDIKSWQSDFLVLRTSICTFSTSSKVVFVSSASSIDKPLTFSQLRIESKAGLERAAGTHIHG